MGVKMDRREFIEKLQRTLAGGLDSVQVAENVRYYQEYIESEIQKGNTEGAVLSQLGDPRLLAKSIIEANKHAGASYGSNQEYDEEVTEDVITEDKKFGRGYGRSIMLPGWLVMVIMTVLVVIVIGFVTSLISIFASSPLIPLLHSAFLYHPFILCLLFPICSASSSFPFSRAFFPSSSFSATTYALAPLLALAPPLVSQSSENETASSRC